MTNQEILKKAIEKVVKNGYCQEYFAVNSIDNYINVWSEFGVKIDSHNWYYGLIFDHSFAKAFWGEEPTRCKNCDGTEKDYPCEICCQANREELLNWQYHLQRMVLEDEPLKYLEKFL